MTASDPSLDPDRLHAGTTSFVNAESWSGARRVLDRYPELLDGRAPGLLITAAKSFQGEHPALAQAWEQCAAVLRRCREIGVEAAMAELERVRKARPEATPMATNTGAPTPPALTAFLEADGLDAVRILEEHPEIATPACIERIDEYIAHFRAQGDAVSVRTLEARRDLLRRW